MNDLPEQEVAIFNAARRLAAQERAAYLDQACAGDAALRRRLDELLRVDEGAGDFLEKPALAEPNVLAMPGGIVPPAVPLSEKPGDRIGPYKLLRQIGEGGCGVVYMAEQEAPIRRRVALKVIKLGMDTKQVIARFEAERQALALMDHPNIARVLDAGATETGRPYFVMELVHGIKITDYCDQDSLTTRQRLDLFIQVCQAIQHAHQKGVIHRDIKPSNILVTVNDGVAVPKVIDFGIAKATQGRLTDQTLFTAFGQFMGTPAYMSPEQAVLTGVDVDTRSDIYSLGVLLYELLTGQTPFDPKSLFEAGLEEMRRTIREQEPARPSTKLSTMNAGELTATAKRRSSDPPKLIHLVRGDLDWIVMKCLEKDRNRRYETANGLARDVERHLENEPVFARPPSHLYRFKKMVARNRLAFSAASAVAASLVVGLGVSTWMFMKEKTAEHAQARLRQQAELDRANEAIQRQRAEDTSADLRATLSAFNFSQASRLIEEGYRSDALAHLVASLSLNPSNDAARVRLAVLLGGYSWMVPTVVLKHDDLLSTAQFSPDGRRIVTASYDKTARIWDAKTGQPLGEPMRHDDIVSSAQFSPDGRRIVTASYDGIARVWDAQNGQPLLQPLKHGRAVNTARFSPDGQRIVTASADGTARVWDAQSGQPSTEPLRLKGSVYGAEFSPDSKKIATVSGDGAPRDTQVWDALTGRALTRPMHVGAIPISSMEFSPDGRQVLTSGFDNTARVWNAETGQPLLEPLRHDDIVKAAKYSPDGKRIVTASLDNTARVWDAANGKPLGEALKHGNYVVSAQFSPDGHRIVTASLDGMARIWDAQNGQLLMEPLKHSASVDLAQFSPDGKRIMTISGEGAARVWDSLSGEPLPEVLEAGGDVRSVHFSPDGQRILTGSDDHTAQLWDARTGQRLAVSLKHGSQVTDAEFSPDGRRIVTTSYDGTARVWDAQSGQPVTAPLKHNDLVSSARFCPDGQRVVTVCADQTARVWDAQSGLPLAAPMKHGGAVTSAEFSPDGKRIATASHDGTARVWDAQTGLPLTDPLKHGAIVQSAFFSPDGKGLLTCSFDSTAPVWDAQTGKLLFQPLKHRDVVQYAVFSPDGRRIVTTSTDHTARVWDALTGQPVTEPLKHRGIVGRAQFSPDSRLILTCSSDGAARIWDAQSGQPLSESFTNSGWVWGEFSPDGTRIVTRSGRTARVSDIAPSSVKLPGWLPEMVEAISGQTLNRDGVLAPTGLNRAEVISRLKLRFSQEPMTNDWDRWFQWFLADPSTRTISPFARFSVPEYIEHRLQENTEASLDEAERLADGNGELLRRITVGRAVYQETNHPTVLQGEADKLARQGHLIEAESLYRQALAANRALWTNEPTRWRASINALANILMREKKFDQALETYNEILTGGFVTQPQNAGVICDRGFLLGRRGRWKEADADFRVAIGLDPDQENPYFYLTAVLVQTGDLGGIARHAPGFWIGLVGVEIRWLSRSLPWTV